MRKVYLGGSAAVVAVIMAAIIASSNGGGGTPTPTATSTATATATATTQPGLANVWVTPAGGTCTRSSTRVALNASTSCSDFDQASNAAQAGDLILVRAGDYDSYDGTDKAITIRADEGQRSTWWMYFRSGDCCFTMDGGPGLNLVVDDNGGPSMGGGTHDVTIKNNEFIASISIDGPGPNANLVFDHNWHHDVGAGGNPAGSISLNYSDIACNCTIKNSLFENFPADGVQTGSAVLIENNIFNNINPATDEHTDNIQGVGATGVVARGNLVTGDCEQGITSFDSGGNMTFENNVIAGCTAHWLSIGAKTVAESLAGATIKNNTIDTLVAPGSTINCENATSVTLRNNITGSFYMPGCPGVVRSNNMVRSDLLSGDFIGIPVFTGGSGRKKFRDYCLSSGSPGFTGANDGGQVGACGAGYSGAPPDDWYTFDRSDL
jgi:hypothetical protein